MSAMWPPTPDEWMELFRKGDEKRAAYLLEHGRWYVWRETKISRAISIAAGWVEAVGDFLVKLSCRITGEPPLGVNESCALGQSFGQIDAWKAGGRVGALLTVMLEPCLGLRKYSLTPEELAAETTMTADRVRELLGNEMATQDELQQISTGIFDAHGAQFDAQRAKVEWESFTEDHRDD